MPTINTATPSEWASLDAVVIRCGCTPEQKRAPDWHGSHGRVCPRPRAREDLGTVAYWHRSLWRRLSYCIHRFINRSYSV